MKARYLIPLLVLLGLVFIILAVISHPKVPYPGVWVTASLERDGEDLYYCGTSLMWPLRKGTLYTYRSKGEYAILLNQRWENGCTYWTIPTEMQDLDWSQATVDWKHLLPEMIPFPAGASPGTSSY